MDGRAATCSYLARAACTAACLLSSCSLLRSSRLRSAASGPEANVDVASFLTDGRGPATLACSFSAWICAAVVHARGGLPLTMPKPLKAPEICSRRSTALALRASEAYGTMVTQGPGRVSVRVVWGPE